MKKAIEANEYVTAINEHFSSAYFNKANALANLNKQEEAVAVYLETLKYEEPEPTTFYYIGECYEKLRQFDKAREFYMKAIELDGYFADAWMGLGAISEETNDLKSALHYMEKAVDAEPINPEFR
jgi:tetratricopeptide (TPR) repeat protein